MRRTVIQLCEVCGEPSEMRIRQRKHFWWGTWHWFCVKCTPASIKVMTNADIPEHAVVEYNVHGNVCHFPGCDKTEAQHPKEIKQ